MADDLNSGRPRTNPPSRQSGTRTRDRRISSATRSPSGHAVKGGGGSAQFFFRLFGPQFGLKIRGGLRPPLDPPLDRFEGGILTQFPSQQCPQTEPQCNSTRPQPHSFKMTSAVDDKKLCNNYQESGEGGGF